MFENLIRFVRSRVWEINKKALGLITPIKFLLVQCPGVYFFKSTGQIDFILHRLKVQMKNSTW